MEHVIRPAAGRVRTLGPGVIVVVLTLGYDPFGLRSFTSLRWAAVSIAVAATAWVSARGALPGVVRVAGGGLLVLMTAASATGLDPVTAWLGHPQRHLGLLAWVIFALAAMVGAGLARPDAADARRFLALGAVVAGAITTAVTVAQLLGWDPLGVTFAGGRLGGLFGQPATLAAACVLLAPLACVAPAPRMVRGGVVVGLGSTLVATQTRGAVLGVVIVAVIAAPLVTGAWKQPGRRTRVLLVAGAIASILAVVVTPAGSRWADAADSGRIDEWRVAWQVIADAPMLGVGPEGYRIAVLDHLDADYVATYGRDVVIDRAHSAPLDVAASGGLLSGAAYLVLLGAVVVATRRLVRGARAEATDPIALAAGLGATGYLACGLVAFPVPELDAVAWLFAGLALTCAWPAPASPPAAPVARRARAAALGIVVAVATVAGVTDVIADHQLRTAITTAGTGRVADAVRAADRATELRPDLIDGWYVAAQVAASGPSLLDLDAGLDRVKAGLGHFPTDPALNDLHLELLTERALRSESAADLAAARDALDRRWRADPTSLLIPDLHGRLNQVPTR